MQVKTCYADMRAAPYISAGRTNQALFGEVVEVLEWGGDMHRVRLLTDGYEDWMLHSNLTHQRFVPTHWVCEVTAPVRHQADDKADVHAVLGMGSLVEVTRYEGHYAFVARLGWVLAVRLKPIGVFEDDFVAVFKKFESIDYEWGCRWGRFRDCSSALQQAMHATGRLYPRDTKDQLKAPGFRRVRKRAIEPGRSKKGTFYPVDVGYIVFWKGHVGVVLEDGRFLHGTGDEFGGFVEEDFQTVVARRRERGEGEIIAVYRL